VHTPPRFSHNTLHDSCVQPRQLTCPRARRVTGLDHEALDDAVEDDVVVVAFQAQLHEVAACLGRLLGPKLQLHVTSAGDQHHLARRGRL
jgi:hypothetical protein